MREIIINQYSRLFYGEEAQQFVYIANAAEIALFGSKGIGINQSNVGCHEDDLLLLEEHQIYTFQIPDKSFILITRLQFQDPVCYQFYHSLFQHQEMKALCIMIANQMGVREEKDELLLTAFRSKLEYLVLNHYSYQGDVQEKNRFIPDEERIQTIHKILQNQSHEEITLVELANQLHLTPQYVSQYFKNCFGVSFLHYLSNVRLQHAMRDIQYTNKSFLDIAMECGFANIRSFQSTFVQTFHCTPKQYRKLLQQKSITQIYRRANTYYTSFMQKKMGDLPANYRDDKEVNFHVILHALEAGVDLSHTWRNLMTVGRARLLLIDDIRKQLIDMQKDIGFSMIRFHGIFNDDMHVYEEDAQGQPQYNFHQVNDVLDFILSIGLKPFVELGFMPSQLAKHPEMTILNRLFIVSPPKDDEKWQNLIRAFLKSCINRYGLDEVMSWYFEFWNSSGIDYDDQIPLASRKTKFWQGTLDEYLQFYKSSYRAVKSIHPDLRIGGPSVSIQTIQRFPENINMYSKYMKKHHCTIDFLTLHLYPTYIGTPECYTIELGSAKEEIDKAKKWMKKNKMEMEVHITEWSTWGYHSDQNFNDGCRKAIYVLKQMMDTLDQVDSLGYWTFSDYTETMKTKHNDIFSDNVGLLTRNGIAKASYHAYTLLYKMGNVQLSKGENYLFTRKNKNYQLLLLNYCDPKQDKKETACFHMSLRQIPNGNYEKKIYFLNETSGSSYDIWKQMGSHQELMEEDVQYLKAHSMMSYVRESITIEDHQDFETRNLKVGEAILIEWIYKY